MGAWLNGEFVDRPMIPADGACSLSGRGVFTTIGIYDGQPWFSERHFERLKRDGAELGLKPEWDKATVVEALRELIRREDVENGLARLTLLGRGDGRWSREEGSDLLILARNAEVRSSSDVKLQVGTWNPSPTRPLASVKTTSYGSYVEAWRIAHAEGFTDALLINTRGEICECARANLVWRVGDRLHSSSLETGCLNGLGRSIVTELAEGLGIRVEFGRTLWEEFLRADEVFTVSAAAGIRRVDSVASAGALHRFGAAVVIPRLQAAWRMLALAELSNQS